MISWPQFIFCCYELKSHTVMWHQHLTGLKRSHDRSWTCCMLTAALWSAEKIWLSESAETGSAGSSKFSSFGPKMIFILKRVSSLFLSTGICYTAFQERPLSFPSSGSLRKLSCLATSPAKRSNTTLQTKKCFSTAPQTSLCPSSSGPSSPPRGSCALGWTCLKITQVYEDTGVTGTDHVNKV